MVVDVRAVTGSTFAWANQPAALTEFLGSVNYRRFLDLSNAAQARIVVRVATAGAAGSQLRLQYSTDGGTNWADAGPSVGIATAGLGAGTWSNLVAGAKADAQFRIAGSGGDGVVNPSFYLVEIETR
jgi:hypothetical protein